MLRKIFVFCLSIILCVGFSLASKAEDGSYFTDVIVKNNDRQDALRIKLDEKSKIIKNTLKIVNKNNKYGVTKRGKIIIPAEYDSIEPYNYCFIVSKNNLKGCFSEEGKIIVPVNYDKVKFISESESFIVVYKNGKAGLYKYDGTMIYNPMFKDIVEFSTIPMIPDFLLYKTNGKTDIVIFDNSIKTVVSDADFIPTEYSDMVGRRISTFIFDMYGTPISLAIKKNGKWGVVTYLEHNGKIIVNPDFIYDNVVGYPNENVKDFRTDLTAFFIQQNNKWGLMMPYPRKIIPPQYDNVERLAGMIYKAKKGNKYGLINAQKIRGTDFVFDEIIKTDDGNIKLIQNGKTAILNPYLPNDLFKEL